MKSNKFSIKKITENKRFLAIFSVLVAFVIWLSVVLNQTPNIERNISNIPITVSTNGQTGENVLQEISGAFEKTINVRVKGPAYVVSSLTADDIKVMPTLDAVVVPGQYNVTLNATKNSLSGEYSIIGVSPSELTTKFDYIIDAVHTVEIEADGIKLTDAAAETGLIDRGLRFNNAVDSQIKISGPKTEVDKVKKVVALVDQSEKIGKTTSYEAQIVLFDENGAKLDSSLYNLSTSKVKVSKVIYKKKTVPVVPTFVNAPVGFSEQVKWELSDKEIEIMGEPENINTIEKIELPPINLTDISPANKSVEMPLEFSGGVESVDNTTAVTVTFDISGFVQKSFTVTDVVGENNPNNLSVTLNSSIKNVKICGPKSVINKLSADDLYAKIDVTDKIKGEYILPVTIVSRSGKVLWQVGDYEASVSIK